MYDRTYNTRAEFSVKNADYYFQDQAGNNCNLFETIQWSYIIIQCSLRETLKY